MKHLPLSTLLLLLCLSVSPIAAVDDGFPLTKIPFTLGYGIELLANDVNDDILLLYVRQHYDGGAAPEKDSLRVVFLKRISNGSYISQDTEVLFETDKRIQQLDWAYDSVSRRFLVTFLDGEAYASYQRILRVVFIGLDGRKEGKIRKIDACGFQPNFPVISFVPPGTKSAPGKARFMLAYRAWHPATKKQGVASVCLNSKGRAISSPDFAVEEFLSSAGTPSHYPISLHPTGDGKGFLLACIRKENELADALPTVLLLDSKGKSVKRIAVSGKEAKFYSFAIHPFARGKFVCSWSDSASSRFWTRVVSADLKSMKPARLVGTQPCCTGQFEYPRTILSKPDTAKKPSLFCVGDSGDPTVYSALVKKSGAVKEMHRLTDWDSVSSTPYHQFLHWFAVASIKGSDELLCVVAIRIADIDIWGYVIQGN